MATNLNDSKKNALILPAQRLSIFQLPKDAAAHCLSEKAVAPEIDSIRTLQGFSQYVVSVLDSLEELNIVNDRNKDSFPGEPLPLLEKKMEVVRDIVEKLKNRESPAQTEIDTLRAALSTPEEKRKDGLYAKVADALNAAAELIEVRILEIRATRGFMPDTKTESIEECRHLERIIGPVASALMTFQRKLDDELSTGLLGGRTATAAGR